MGLEDAYAVQLRGRALREADGASVVGRKVGLTSAAMQELLGVGEPDFGYLTDRMLHDDGAAIATAGLVAPRAEAEIAFRLASPLRGPDVDRDQALAAIGEVAPSLEVVDSRVVDWRIALPDTVADNASSGRAVLGRFVAIGETDLAAVAMTMTVEHGDGRTESESGDGAAVLGNPAEALAWVVRALAPFGEGVDAGEVVIPGAMARAITITAAGADVAADFGALGRVTAVFDRRGS
jgi:2-keto-4-pentenoate hydratase